MTSAAFLLVALALSAIGSLVIWWRTRKPQSIESGIDAFSRELRALSPDADTDRWPPRRRLGDGG